MMGCSPGDNDCTNNEKPARQVTITRGFRMGQTEVTQAAYFQVTGKNPSSFKGANLPIESVSWDAAENYCSAVGGRLPSEKEWEYAARAGTTGSRYGALDSIAWHYDNSGRKTNLVGVKQANAYGLHDMLGNVWEWTADNFDAGRKIVRGGSWNDTRYVSASVRGRLEPTFRSSALGFRCVEELR